MLAMRIEQRHRHRLRLMAWHHFNQFPGLDMRPDVIGRNLDQAEACKTAGDIGFGAVSGDPTAHRQGSHHAILHPLPILDPAGGGGGIVDGPVSAQVIGRLRPSMVRQIVGAGYGQFKREIVAFALTKGSLTYAEIEEQIRCDVLGAKLADGSPASYNRNIAGKYWPKVIGGIVRC